MGKLRFPFHRQVWGSTRGGEVCRAGQGKRNLKSSQVYFLLPQRETVQVAESGRRWSFIAHREVENTSRLANGNLAMFWGLSLPSLLHMKEGSDIPLSSSGMRFTDSVFQAFPFSVGYTPMSLAIKTHILRHLRGTRGEALFSQQVCYCHFKWFSRDIGHFIYSGFHRADT